MDRKIASAGSVGLLLTAAIVLLSLPGGGVAQAAEPQALAGSGMFSLGNGQTARFFLANAARPNAPSCQAELVFVDDAGTRLTIQAVSVPPQQARYYELANNGAKIAIRAVALIDRRTCRRRNIILSVEVFDATTGETVFVPPSPVQPPNPV